MATDNIEIKVSYMPAGLPWQLILRSLLFLSQKGEKHIYADTHTDTFTQTNKQKHVDSQIDRRTY